MISEKKFGKKLGKVLGNKVFLSFLIPFAVMMTIIICRGIYPFGDNSFLHMDMYHQYMPFFSEFLHKLKNGESLFYSWNLGLGSNFLALFSYYLASPANWLVVLFPESHLMEFMTYLIVIKIGFCGTSFFLWLRYHFKEENKCMVFFSCFYALSGFMAAYNWNIMWLDNVILAPLIILGLEKLFFEKKYLLYTLTLGMSILSDYYLSIMICIFAVLYFLVLCVENPRFVKRAFSFGGCSLLAGGLAGILLVPAYCALHFSEFGQFAFPKKISAYFSLWDILARHFMNVTTEQKLDHWPNIYCGVAVLLLVPLYIMNKKISVREKIAKIGLMFFFLAGFSINILVFIWHGFNYPDSLPARQSFLYVFLVLTICYEAWKNLDGITSKALGGSLAGAAVFLLLCEKLLGYEDDFSLDTYYVTGLFLLFYAGLFYLYRRYGQDAKLKRRLLILAAVLVIGESGINMAVTSVSITDRTDYLGDLDAYRALTARTKGSAPDFYRFEKWKRTTKNDGTLAGYPMASVFSSTVNSYIGDLYEEWGMGYSKVFYCFDGATPFTSALLNVRYMFSEDAVMDGGGLYTQIAEQDGIYLYECRETLPLGFMLPDEFQIIGHDKGKKEDRPFQVQNNMARGLAGGKNLFVNAAVKQEDGGACIIPEQSGYYYVYSRSKKTKNMTVSVNGEETEYKNMGNGYILPVGYVEKGSFVKITCEETETLNLTACRLDTDRLAQVINRLREQPFMIDAFASDKIDGHIRADKAGRLFFSIPYEPGWKLTVDGEEVQIEWYADAFISVWLEEGEHVITLRYFPEGLKAGIAVSAVSLLILLGMIWFGKKRRSNNNCVV